MPPEIERAILAAIAEGRMKPGERLSETQLAEVFDVSRTIVREALMRLEGRHIISVSPRRGWFVNTPSIQGLPPASGSSLTPTTTLGA